MLIGITAAGVIATFVVALLTLRANKVSGRAQITATEAYAEALQSNREASQKQVEALQSLVDRVNDSGRAPEESNRPKAKWELRADSRKHRWNLHNIGDAVARDAVLRPATEQDRNDLHAILEEPTDISPGSAIPFGVWRSMASPPATVAEVVWSDEEGVQHSSTFVIA